MTVRPCKKPRVTVEPRTPGDDRYDATCHVPGCAWTYPADKQFMALKSDAESQATRHRAEHRAGVPKTWIEKAPEYDVHCEGHQAFATHRRTFGTRKAAVEWLDQHLATEHGVIVS